MEILEYHKDNELLHKLLETNLDDEARKDILEMLEENKKDD